MPNTFTSLYYHLIFSTKNREPLVALSWRERLYKYMGGTVRGFGGMAIQIGGVEDHVHMLVSRKLTMCISDLLRALKKASSSWVSDVIGQCEFQWQDGYSAFTVSASAIDSVRRHGM